MIDYLKTFKRYSYLLKLFVKRDIEKKYRGAFLGILWSLLNPLLNMVVLAIIFTALFSRDIENYPLYLISGRIIFDFFSSTSKASLKSISGSRALLQKIYFPRYMIVMSTVISNFITFIISFADLFLIMIITGASLTKFIWLLPIYLLIFLIFNLGVAFILSLLNAYFRDIEHLYGILVTLLMYFSAIFYPASIIPEQYRFLLMFNPLYQFIEGFRAILYYGQMPSAMNFGMCLLYAGLSIIIGTLAFIKFKDKAIMKI